MHSASRRQAALDLIADGLSDGQVADALDVPRTQRLRRESVARMLEHVGPKA